MLPIYVKLSVLIYKHEAKTSKDAENDITPLDMPKKMNFLTGSRFTQLMAQLMWLNQWTSIQLSNTHTSVWGQSAEESLPLDEIKANQN